MVSPFKQALVRCTESKINLLSDTSIGPSLVGSLIVHLDYPFTLVLPS